MGARLIHRFRKLKNHRVDPAYTSQICSRCGNIVEKDLSIRMHECPYCNLRMDRDINAARNILKRGLGAAGMSAVKNKSANLYW